MKCYTYRNLETRPGV